MAGFAAAHGLARLTFTQRTIEAPLPSQNQRFWRNTVLETEIRKLGRTIVAGHRQSGLTQRQLAEVTRIPRKALGRWERGRAMPNDAEWRVVARVLNIPNASSP